MDHDDTQAMVGPTRPVLRTWIELGARVADTAVRTGFAAARDVHDAWKERVHGTLDLLRKLSGHVDGVVEEAFAAGEEGFTGLVRTVRTTAADATDAAVRASAHWVGSSGREAA